MKAKPKKIGLSQALEENFFKKRLDQKSILNLRKHCLAYQEGEPPAWKPSILEPYSSYFGFLTALKVKAAVNELIHFGYHQVWDSPVKLIDFGAGTLGASLGAMDALASHGIETEGLLAIDKDPRAALWAFKNFSSQLPEKRSIQKSMKKLKLHRPCLFVFSNVLVEIFAKESRSFEQELRDLIRSANEKTIFLFIEPANFDFNQSFLGFRDRVTKDAQILLPCTHQAACPALQQKEWCHEERAYKATGLFWNLVADLGFRKANLNFSFLALGQQKSIFAQNDARVVSQALETKGISTRWLCSDGKRWKQNKLHKEKNENNQAFYDSLRGDVLKIEDDGQKINALSTQAQSPA